MLRVVFFVVLGHVQVGIDLVFLRLCLGSGLGLRVSVLYSCWLCCMDIGAEAPSTIDVEPEVLLHALPPASEQVPVLIQECFGIAFEHFGAVALFNKHRKHTLTPPDECASCRAESSTSI